MAEAGAAKTNAAKAGLTKAGATSQAAEAGAAVAGMAGTGVTEAGAAVAGMTGTGATEAGAVRTGMAEARATEAGAVKAGMTGAGATEAGAVRTGMAEARATEAGAVRTGMAEAGALETECCEVVEVHEDLLKIVKETMPDEEELNDLADLFKVFGDYTRIRILFVLFEAEVCVCDLAQALNMTQSAISHQLKILKQNRLVKSRREGKSIFYSLADEHVRTIIGKGREHIEED